MVIEDLLLLRFLKYKWCLLWVIRSLILVFFSFFFFLNHIDYDPLFAFHFYTP